MPSPSEIAAVLPQFVGTIQQIPPAYSALRRDGRRAYELARAGRPLQLEPRPVIVYSMDLLRYEYPALELDIHCGRGTYIRALARDIAAGLGTSGYLTSLRRTAVGAYTVDRASSLASLTAESVAAAILP